MRGGVIQPLAAISILVGIAAGVVTIVATLVPPVRRVVVALVSRRTSKPLNPETPVDISPLEFKDVAYAVEKLAETIQAKSADLLLGIDRGGAIVGGMLAKRLGIPLRLLHRSADGKGYVESDCLKGYEGKRIVLVDDASRSGRALERAVEYVRAVVKPSFLTTCVILLTKTKYRHEETGPSKLVDCYVYHTSRTDIWFPWDLPR